jgi:hypothetical protein
MSFGNELKDFVAAFQVGASIGGKMQDRKLARETLEARKAYWLSKSQPKGDEAAFKDGYAHPGGGGGGATTSAPNGGAGGGKFNLNDDQKIEMRDATLEAQKKYGYDPEKMVAIFSYETGGTLDPWQKGPTTKWGQHRGLIQWGEPQRKQYGVDQNTSIHDQVMASAKYLKDRGVTPNMSLEHYYAAINAGDPSLVNASDAGSGGAPGTVTDKVQTQFAPHLAAARALLSFKGVEVAGAPTQAIPTAGVSKKPDGTLVSDGSDNPYYHGKPAKPPTGSVPAAAPAATDPVKMQQQAAIPAPPSYQTQEADIETPAQPTDPDDPDYQEPYQPEEE